jgi:hypothetical protein
MARRLVVSSTRRRAKFRKTVGFIHRDVGRPRVGARYFRAVAIALALGLPLNALADSPPLNLKCAGDLVFSQPLSTSARSIAFQAIVPFGDGYFLALTNPETRAIERPLYDMEVLSGSLQVEGAPPETIVWTRTSGRNGEIVGQAIASDGEMFSLAVERAPVGSSRRPFTLFGTAGSSLYRGACE